jgi:Gamma-glutamyl cyclotransferase, AIG2-like
VRRLDVFFYGLFMDADLLRAKGVSPENIEQAVVDDFALRIGRRAALVSAPGHCVYGLVMSLTRGDLDHLYADPSVSEYRPQALLARLAGGETVPVLCYNVPRPPSPDEHNPDYAAALRAVAEKVGLPMAEWQSG